MSLEEKLDSLTSAIEALTKVMSSSAVTQHPSSTSLIPSADSETSEPKAKKKTKTKTKVSTREDEVSSGAVSSDNAADEDDNKVTANSLRELAKKKIDAGVSRQDIKEMITKLGAEAIGELDQKGMDKLHKKLMEL